MKRVVASSAVFLVLLMAASFLARDLSGMPDDWPVPAVMLPASLFGVADGRMAWLFACAAYFFAPALVAALSKDVRSAASASGTFALVLVGVSWAILPSIAVHDDYVPTFNADLRTRGLIWLFALTQAGATLGTVIASLRKRA